MLQLWDRAEVWDHGYRDTEAGGGATHFGGGDAGARARNMAVSTFSGTWALDRDKESFSAVAKRMNLYNSTRRRPVSGAKGGLGSASDHIPFMLTHKVRSLNLQLKNCAKSWTVINCHQLDCHTDRDLPLTTSSHITVWTWMIFFTRLEQLFNFSKNWIWQRKGNNCVIFSWLCFDFSVKLKMYPSLLFQWEKMIDLS